MRKRSQELRIKICGAPEHEKCKEEMRKKSQMLCAKTAALYKHKNKKNPTSQKHQKVYGGNSKWALFHVSCVINVYIENLSMFLLKRTILFEPVRPDVVKLVTDYLKQNNFLYNNIVLQFICHDMLVLSV